MSSTPGSEQTSAITISSRVSPARASLSQPAQRQDGPVAAEGSAPSAAHTAHHYVLEPPSGPIVHGVCKTCGAERDWVTAGTDSDRYWDGTISKAEHRQRAGAAARKRHKGGALSPAQYASFYGGLT